MTAKVSIFLAVSSSLSAKPSQPSWFLNHSQSLNTAKVALDEVDSGLVEACGTPWNVPFLTCFECVGSEKQAFPKYNVYHQVFLCVIVVVDVFKIKSICITYKYI